MNRKQFVPFENVVQPDNSLLLAVFPDPESHPDFLEQLDSCWETLHRAKFALIPKLLPFFCRDGDTGGFDNIENIRTRERFSANAICPWTGSHSLAFTEIQRFNSLHFTSES